ncbi:hypothetical protein LZ554_005645 [Drepanopeziza brunnea f. sp. 'monogermtubi']|nr:hypothetical protein LZ554_005645 [Drepanopeziza brunnea f. sp. 'monogermtubi']
MSETEKIQKTMEVKMRDLTTKVRSDQNGLARVYFTNQALAEIGVERPGQLIHLWKTGDEIQKEAVAWNTADKSLRKNIAQIASEYREFLGFKLEDDINVRAAGLVPIANSIVLRELSAPSEPPQEALGKFEKVHWAWFLHGHLSRAETIYPGMEFTGIAPFAWAKKRSFVVDFVNGKPTGLGKCGSSSSVQISTPQENDPEPQVTFQSAPLEVLDIAGIDQALGRLNSFFANFNKKKFVFPQDQRSCAVLLHGGPGTGKTFLLSKITSTGWAKSVLRLEGNAKVSNIRSTFRDAKLSQPSIIVLDDIESLVGKEDDRYSDIAHALGEELDVLSRAHSGDSLPQVVVVATASDPNRVPRSLKKRGRFVTEIALPVPDVPARKAILRALDPQFLPAIRDENIDRLGDRTHAYTAEDLVNLLDAARHFAEKRVDADPTQSEDGHYLLQRDIEEALLLVRPTAMHDITLQPPSVRWDEIGGQDSIKKALRRAVETPLLHPGRMKRLGAVPKKGVLLYGPPGCSKTLSAQAMATETGFNFFAVKGAELLNMYVGESERAVRDIFARARAANPSIIFFDEIESIGSKRSSNGRNTGVNVLTTLLTEMDGIETLKGVFVLAATNQPQALDPALLRPGRFDKLLYVAPPDLEGRKEILQVRKRIMDLADDVDIDALAELTDGYSGAELVGICQTACDYVIDKCDDLNEELQVHMEDFMDAIQVVQKQIDPKMIASYEEWARGI